ncbi:MAG: hypothetical protein U1F23_07480 [Lysobacterales bacterium]
MRTQHPIDRARTRGTVVRVLAAVVASVAANALAVPVPQPILTINQLLWQVAPDECFDGLGVDYPPINPDGTCLVGQPKANQSYIWSLTEANGKLWFGTLANGFCLVSGNRTDIDPILNSDLVCEYGLAEQVRENPGFPPFFGDWRPPRIYTWDLGTGELAEVQVNSPLLLKNTLGLRGAGTIGNYVFLAGPSLNSASANFFAFRADTGQFLGSCARTDYNYVRGFSAVDGVLYVGLGNNSYGAVLRWNSPPGSAPLAANWCSRFTEVGQVTADVANITKYIDADGQDRLAVSTVPIQRGTGGVAGVWISPVIPQGGLTSNDINNWQQVWTPLEYDPDRITARYGYSGGAVAYYDGWLYWGTIHLQTPPAFGIHETCTYSFCFGMPQNNQELQALKNGIYRSTSVWRGRNLEDPNTREVELLYGESELPACCSAPKTFAMQPTGWTPLYGPSGFGNRGNLYTWRMAVFDGHLFIGTQDASGRQGPAGQPEAGADLWRFDSSDSPAVNENYSGLGDINNYGIRALHPLDDGSGLIAGMVNSFNLAPGGGWELRLLQEGSSSPTTPPTVISVGH